MLVTEIGYFDNDFRRSVATADPVPVSFMMGGRPTMMAACSVLPAVYYLWKQRD